MSDRALDRQEFLSRPLAKENRLHCNGSGLTDRGASLILGRTKRGWDAALTGSNGWTPARWSSRGDSSDAWGARDGTRRTSRASCIGMRETTPSMRPLTRRGSSGWWTTRPALLFADATCERSSGRGTRAGSRPLGLSRVSEILIVAAVGDRVEDGVAGKALQFVHP